jgi:hypothetical protein
MAKTTRAMVVTHPDGSIAIAMPAYQTRDDTEESWVCTMVAASVVYMWLTAYTYMLLSMSVGSGGRCEWYEQPAYRAVYSAVFSAFLLMIVMQMRRISKTVPPHNCEAYDATLLPPLWST